MQQEEEEEEWLQEACQATGPALIRSTRTRRRVNYKEWGMYNDITYKALYGFKCEVILDRLGSRRPNNYRSLTHSFHMYNDKIIASFEKYNSVYLLVYKSTGILYYRWVPTCCTHSLTHSLYTHSLTCPQVKQNSLCNKTTAEYLCRDVTKAILRVPCPRLHCVDVGHPGQHFI